MRKVLIIFVILVLLLVGGGAAAYFLLGPDEALKMVGLGQPEPTPIPPGDRPPTPTEDPGQDILVARFDIPDGTLITDTIALLETKNIPTNAYNAQADTLFKDSQIGEVKGMVLNLPVLAGEPIERGYLSKPGLAQQMPTAERNRPRPKAYPVEVNSFSGVADQVHEGDTVDVVATFTLQRRVYHLPEVQTNEQGQVEASVQQTDQGTTIQAPAEQRQVETVDFKTTKTIVQRAKVLAILRPPPPTPVPAPPEDGAEAKPAEDAPTAEPGAAPAGTPAAKDDEEPIKSKITQGTWQVVLAVNDQQAELIEFAVRSDADVTLVLRGAGDEEYEETIGATFDLLLSEFGLPLPQPYEPYVYPVELLTPEPTRTPAPTRVP